jgi:hypothetical protein
MAEVTQGMNVDEVITSDTLRIKRYTVNLEQEWATAVVEVLSEAGEVTDTKTVTFWATMPQGEELFESPGVPFDPPQYAPVPETWFDIPAAKVPVLSQLGTDILTAVNNRFFS